MTAENVSIDTKCHDCGADINIVDEQLENGVYLAYDHNDEKINIFKCNDCYAKNPALTNFQKCEVYSRVVGYIRPVQQWHKGKKQEYAERQEYAMPDSGACGC